MIHSRSLKYYVKEFKMGKKFASLSLDETMKLSLKMHGVEYFFNKIELFAFSLH